MQARPLLVETVAEDDASDDLTSAVDLSIGLELNYDTRLLLLTNERGTVNGHRDAIQLWSADPNLPDELRMQFDILQPDIVHTHRLQELAAVGHAARNAGAHQIVHTVCADIAGAPKWKLDQFARVTESLAPLLVAPNEKIAEQLNPMAQVEIVPMGIDCERYFPGDRGRARRKTGLPAKPKVIGCASPVSGIGTLLQTLFHMNSEVHLALFGQAQPGPAERNLIRRLGLGERVHVLGAWAKPELVFQAIDVYFHGPSNSYLPRAVLAAQACGKPTIACAPAPSIVLCPNTGRLAPMQYMPALLHSLQRTLNSSDSAITRRFILDNWSHDHSLKGYSALFRQLAEQHQPKRRLA